MISNTFFANNDPGGMCRLVVHTGELVSVLSLTLMNDQIMLNNNGCLFASYLSSGSKLSLNYVSITGSYFFNTAGTGYWAETNSSGTLTMKQYHWDPSNRVTPGIALTGGLASQLTTGVCASFYFAPEPTGFNGPLQNYPAVPVGTGSANARQNCLPYPLTFFMNVTSSAGVVLQTGGHIIDVLSSNTDKAIYNTPTFTLYPGDKIYFATNVPYAWIPYGDQW